MMAPAAIMTGFESITRVQSEGTVSLPWNFPRDGSQSKILAAPAMRPSRVSTTWTLSSISSGKTAPTAMPPSRARAFLRAWSPWE